MTSTSSLKEVCKQSFSEDFVCTIFESSFLTLCLLGYFASFFVINFLKKSSRNTIRVSNSLDPDQALHFDPVPNFLQRLSADDALR